MKQHSPRFLKLVEEARARVPEVPIDHVRRQPPAHLLDVREESEWQAGHLPGARHLGKGVLERDIEGLIPDLDAEIVLYCGGGFRSLLAGEALLRMGYRRVSSMVDGFRGWTTAGLPVVKSP